MSDWSGLESFLWAARLGSISAAARELGVPRSTVSRRLARLEETLGTPLLDRNTRNLSLTDAGRLVLERGRGLFRELDSLSESVAELAEEPAGLLRIACPTGLAREEFSQFLVEFLQKYPKLSVELIQSDRLADPVQDDFDVVLHPGPFDDSSWVVRRFASADLMLVAAPKYLALKGHPQTVDDLAEHSLLAVHAERGRAIHWPLTPGQDFQVKPVLVSNDLEVIRLAARQGGGLALLPRGIVLQDLASGSLEIVLEDHVGRKRQLYALFSPRKRNSPKVRAYFAEVEGYIMRTQAKYAELLP